MPNQQDDRNQPGVTFDIGVITDTIKHEFSDMHEIRFNVHNESFIENMQQDIVKDFSDLTELYVWIAETRGRLGL